MRRIAIMFIGLYCVLTSTATAGDFMPAPFSLSVEVIATDPGITEVVVGDRFEINGVIDQGIFDQNSSVGGGRFPGLVVSFMFAARPLNPGTWNPAGTFDLGDASNYVTNAFGDNFTFQLRGTGFPDGGPGLPFFDIDLNWIWPGDITDSGLNDPFAGQFGGMFDPLRAVLGPSSIRFQAGSFDFRSATFLPLTPALAGDYNVNGVVDAADYTVWRDRLGGPGILLNDASPGSVSPADYDVWKANFGAVSPGIGAGSGSGTTGSASAAVPEPSSIVLVFLGIAGLSIICRIADLISRDILW
jgi:hypothetical protein